VLVLSRKAGERIQIGDDIGLTVLEICGGKVRLGFTAPTRVPIHREEVYRKIGTKPDEVRHGKSASADPRVRKVRRVGA